MLKSHIIRKLLSNVHTKRFLIFLQKVFRLKPNVFCLTVACARSGSSALVGWLSRHSDVVYVGQSRILPIASRYIQNVDSFKNLHSNRDSLLMLGRNLVWQYYSSKWFIWNRILIDKENFDPTVFPNGKIDRFLDDVRELFPDVKLLFLVREPVATISSMQKKNFGVIA